MSTDYKKDHNNLRVSGRSAGKDSACKAGDPGSIPGLGRSRGEGNGSPLQYSGLENSMDRGAWRATVHGVTKSQTQLSDFHFQQLKIPVKEFLKIQFSAR